MRFQFLVLSFFSLLCPARSQQFAVGVKGGIRTTDDVSGFYVQSPESRSYIVGPMLELRLPWRLGIEFDALHRRLGYTSGSGGWYGSAILRERANSWEFPLIVKYRLPARSAHPFAGAGYAPRTVHGSDVSSGWYLSAITGNPPANVYTYYFNQRTNTDYRITHGFVLCGGVDLDASHIRISPELRYVRWNTPFLDQVGGSGSYFIQSARNAQRPCSIVNGNAVDLALPACCGPRGDARSGLEGPHRE